MWKEFWFKNDDTPDTTQITTQTDETMESVLKSNKSNYPTSGIPNPLKMYLNSVHSDVLGCSKRKHETRKIDNISPEE